MQNIQIGLRHSVGKSSQLYREQDIERIAQIKEFEKYEQLYKSPNILEFPPYVLFYYSFIFIFFYYFYYFFNC